MSMWIESQSGNLINLDAIREFGIIVNDTRGEGDPFEYPHVSYDLYAFDVGHVEQSLGRRKPFADSHRYLLQHARHEECAHVFKKLKDAIKTGASYFNCNEVYGDFYNREPRMKTPRIKTHENGSTS